MLNGKERKKDAHRAFGYFGSDRRLALGGAGWRGDGHWQDDRAAHWDGHNRRTCVDARTRRRAHARRTSYTYCYCTARRGDDADAAAAGLLRARAAAGRASTCWGWISCRGESLGLWGGRGRWVCALLVIAYLSIADNMKILDSWSEGEVM